MDVDPGNQTNEPQTKALQFDYADTAGTAQAAAAVVCTACKQTIPDAYFEVNGKIACAPCRGKLADVRPPGSRAGRFVRAVFAGVVVAGVGAGLYYAVAAITGYEIGLVAIVLGALVGGAVRWGSRARGGWFYQVLAVLLTYASIGTSYSAFAIQEYVKDHRAAAQTRPAPTTAPTAAAAEAADSEGSEHEQAAPPLTFGGALAAIVVGLGVIVTIVMSLPVLASIHQPIGFLIVGFALYQAWRINRRLVLQVSGPYAVGAAATLQTPEGSASAPRG